MDIYQRDQAFYKLRDKGGNGDVNAGDYIYIECNKVAQFAGRVDMTCCEGCVILVVDNGDLKHIDLHEKFNMGHNIWKRDAVLFI